MTTTTDFSKKQLATILSALDDAPRSPANKGEALRAIGRSAQRFGLTTDDVLAAASGLLDGRLSAADFRVELHDLAGPDQTADDGPQGATAAQGDDEPGDTRTEPTEPPQAQEPATSEPAPRPKGKAKAKAKPAKTAPAEKPTPRAGTKQAQMIELLKRRAAPRTSASEASPNRAMFSRTLPG
jgi:outer membrane biosynthesis protein TonB